MYPISWNTYNGIQSAKKKINLKLIQYCKSTILQFLFKVYSLHSPIKRHILSDWIKEQNQIIFDQQELQFKHKDTNRLKIKRYFFEKINESDKPLTRPTSKTKKRKKGAITQY